MDSEFLTYVVCNSCIRFTVLLFIYLNRIVTGCNGAAMDQRQSSFIFVAPQPEVPPRCDSTEIRYYKILCCAIIVYRVSYRGCFGGILRRETGRNRAIVTSRLATRVPTDVVALRLYHRRLIADQFARKCMSDVKFLREGQLDIGTTVTRRVRTHRSFGAVRFNFCDIVEPSASTAKSIGIAGG